MAIFEVPEFIRPDSKFIDDYSAQRLAVLAKNGKFYRVRRSLYLPWELWASFKPWEKYCVNIQAVHELAKSPPIFARESAAQIIGLPIISIPGMSRLSSRQGPKAVKVEAGFTGLMLYEETLHRGKCLDYL